MATFKKLDSGKWQAQVAKHGVRRAQSFPSKRAAQEWASRQEHLIVEGQGRGSKIAVGQAFDRYAREVSPTKRGARWEMIRLEKLGKDKLAKVQLCNLSAQDLADWRDRRLREVAPASVRREMVLISGVMTIARKEWGLISANPMADVRKPANAQPRDRLVPDAEIEALVAVAGKPLSARWRAVHAFRFAIETAMRAGEICNLHAADIDGPVAHLPKTKNGTSRDVPLSSKALQLLADLPKGNGPCFGLTPQQLDALFRGARDLAQIKGLRFHDSRHEAITRLARKLDVLDLARMTGHQNLNELMTYYNASAADLASKLG